MTVAGVKITVYRDPVEGMLTVEIDTVDNEPPVEVDRTADAVLDVRLNGSVLYRPDQPDNAELPETRHKPDDESSAAFRVARLRARTGRQ